MGDEKGEGSKGVAAETCPSRCARACACPARARPARFVHSSMTIEIALSCPRRGFARFVRRLERQRSRTRY